LQSRIRAALHSPDGFRRLRDFVIAAVFFRLPASWRAAMFRGDVHYCPICESHLSEFVILHRDYHLWCPVCRSLQRHRLVWLLLQQRILADGAIEGHMLHIAPETALSHKFEAMDNLVYITSDLGENRVSTQFDICAIPMPDDTFDFLMCSHVLEHVSDDRRAMSEFRRVLTDNGSGVILVPIFAETSFDDPSITDPIERERVFGQLDHVRVYGLDFGDRLRAAGFDVNEVTTTELASPQDVQQMGLPQDETIFLITAR
jgi:SAM-dependent methyltransferase